MLAWDSLLLPRLARIAGERIALLLHYLPSLEPMRDTQRKLSLQAVEQRAAAQADFAIVTGKTVADTVTARWPDKPVFLCEPGVSETFLRHRSDHMQRGVQLVTVAHLLPAKGHGQLLAILERLAHLSWHWHLVGDCDAAPETTRRLREGAARAGLTDRITLHGALPQQAIAALMADCDVFVFPSTFEAYGIAVAEAAAARLPVLSNRVGAAAQLIEHGVTGFLVASGDWESFGGYLQMLLEDAPLRAAFRDHLSRGVVRGWDSTFADFRATCETILR